ncbi:hypothetical protein ABEB36_006549 [Hypothenemus hampei]|uniref:non-specific serine/threonine protein kinase n=1 Tax=Hypothenemus hampei TaxID=57062 RepID=A0ABD1EQW9_HYPHA
MSFDHTLQVRQNNEFEALQAIYAEDLKDLRTKMPWNRWCPLNLSITLTPQRGSSGNGEVYVKVDLHVICTEKYPDELPQLLLEKSKGISQIFLEELLLQLHQKAEEYKGEEMIFQLCQHVQEFLHRHNKPAMKSFYDEMLQTQKEKKIEEEMQKQLEREALRKEIETRQEMLKSEARLRRDRKRSVSESKMSEEIINSRTSSGNKKNSGKMENCESLNCDHKGISLLDFNGRKVQRGQCRKHMDASVVFKAMDVNSGDWLEVAEWTLSSINGQILKNILSIEQELNYLTRLKHVNLAHYLGFKHDEIGSKIVIYVLKESALGPNCRKKYTDLTLKIDIDYLRYLAKGVLNALDYLHRNNVVYKSLSEDCVMIDENGTVRVSDFSIERRLLDIVHSTHGDYSKKNDIFDFGKLLLTLLGHKWNNGDIPTHLPSDLYDLLDNCLKKDEKQRYTANQLSNHAFFHEALVHSPLDRAQDMEIPRNDSPEIVRSFSNTSTNNGQSRIDNEFEFLEHLGKGAFGEVLKVRNKLDGGYYAIKKIKLGQNNKALNKRKILREVTLLSKQNHENIVRYYTSWIETTTIKGDFEEDSSTVATTPTSSPVKKVVKKNLELTLNDNIEELVASLKNVEISVTFDSKSQVNFESSSEDSSDDDDEDDQPFTAAAADSDSDSIEFEHGSQDEDEDEDDSSKEEKKESIKQTHVPSLNTPSNNKELTVDYLYIQMEFCEKSTLRTAIDNHLYTDENRVWRLFREIVEGLAHIHLQGMIHRDLKPVNIFLDSNDHVKIGDFGLATTIAMRKYGENYQMSKSQALENLREEFDESKTGQVGTALYVAPEMNSAIKALYDQKVDIYSLGIIFFEMCYKPLDTGMERFKILSRLRTKDVVFPEGFAGENERAYELIKWLLNHDISKRPTSRELLQSKYLPPPVSARREFRELINQTLNNQESIDYRYLMNSCFQQYPTAAQDITYDRDPTISAIFKPQNVFKFVKDICVKVFERHGGQILATPLTMPKCKFYEDLDSCVNMMEDSGIIVSLPHDLRVPFARFIAWNNLSLFRRYSVERVYKKQKVFGFLPREFYECAFDIVTPTKGNLQADAEVLFVVYEILNKLPGIRYKNVVIRLNHTDLFKWILLHFGLKDKEKELLHVLQDSKEGKVPKRQLQNFLIQHGLSDSHKNLLFNLLHAEIEMSKISNHFQGITKKRAGEASDLAKSALQELKCIAQNAEALGVQYKFVVAPGACSNMQHYSGMLCQFTCHLKKKKKNHDNKDVVAVGGRYDSLIRHYRNFIEQTDLETADVTQTAVGVSISMDKLVQTIQKECDKSDSLEEIVCSGTNGKQLPKEKTKILKDLWSKGVRGHWMEKVNTVEVQKVLMDLGASCVILLNDNEQCWMMLRSWAKESKERFQERLYSTTEVVDNFEKILDSKLSYSEKSDNEPIVTIMFVTVEKLSSHIRKRLENQVRLQLDSLFKKLTGLIIVIGIKVEANVVRTLAAYLDFDSESQFAKSVQNCITRHSKLKRYLNEICEEIWKARTKETTPTVVLYSLMDNFYKLII